MLLHEENQNVISFLDHGKGFMIYKKRLFEAEVLPKYFKKSKVWTSKVKTQAGGDFYWTCRFASPPLILKRTLPFSFVTSSPALRASSIGT
jgi:hypothetical protein